MAVALEKELTALSAEFSEEGEEVENLDLVISVEGLDKFEVAFVQDRRLGGICKHRL